MRCFAVRDDGLEQALEKRVKRLNDRVDINISLEVDAAGSTLTGPKAEILYRFAQEGLHNIGKHVGARKAAVGVSLNQVNRANHILKLTIEDDGRGFAPESSALGGYGITGMREQENILDANLVIQSAPGKETKNSARDKYLSGGFGQMNFGIANQHINWRSAAKHSLQGIRRSLQRAKSVPGVSGIEVYPMCPDWTGRKWCPGAELNHRHADFQFSEPLIPRFPAVVAIYLTI